MKYSISINQKQAVELGLTNINQILILDLLATASTWAKVEIIEGEAFYWVARQVIANELPVLGLKPDTVYRHLKSLAENGFIEHIKRGKKDCIRLAEKGKAYYVGNESEKGIELGNKSEKQLKNSEINPKSNSEINPTYHNTKKHYPTTRKDYPTTNGDFLCSFDDFWHKYPVKKGRKYADEAWKKLNREDKQKAYHGIHGYLSTVRQDKYICHPSTYLNGARWEDEVHDIDDDDLNWDRKPSDAIDGEFSHA